MLLRFYIGAREKGEDWSIWQSARYEVVEAGKWVGRKVTEGGEWLGEQLGVDLAATEGAESQSGSTAPSTEGVAVAEVKTAAPENLLSRSWNTAIGGLGSMVRSSTEAITSPFSSPSSTKSRRSQEPGTWSTGEVHAELVKDHDGTLQYRTLFVDIPNSQAFTRQRVWIVRKRGDVQR